jgi:hypothetical protein
MQEASSNPGVVRSRLGWDICRVSLCVCASVVSVLDNCLCGGQLVCNELLYICKWPGEASVHASVRRAGSLSAGA